MLSWQSLPLSVFKETNTESKSFIYSIHYTHIYLYHIYIYIYPHSLHITINPDWQHLHWDFVVFKIILSVVQSDFLIQVLNNVLTFSSLFFKSQSRLPRPPQKHQDKSYSHSSSVWSFLFISSSFFWSLAMERSRFRVKVFSRSSSESSRTSEYSSWLVIPAADQRGRHVTSAFIN